MKRRRVKKTMRRKKMMKKRRIHPNLNLTRTWKWYKDLRMQAMPLHRHLICKLERRRNSNRSNSMRKQCKLDFAITVC